MNYLETIAMVMYLALVVSIGIYFFFKNKNKNGEKDYFLGGRNMGGWVAALSAGASDMSAWVLMGLPGSIYLAGIGKIWISVGLVIGTICSWIFIAPRLRRYSIRANDSITIPQFLTNRFCSDNNTLQVIAAIIFVIVYCIYSASSISACGDLFNTVTGMERDTAMILATAIILIYTFLGGFNAVCWTDFIQGMLMLIALMLVPIMVAGAMNASDYVAPSFSVGENYFNPLSSGKTDWKSISDILSGLGWGLGYFGMPHILIRFISIKSEREMKKSRIIGCSWITIILLMSTLVGLMGRYFIGDELVKEGNQLIFIHMIRRVFPVFIGGVVLSAILAAAMSTADSQLLASSSSFASDIYKPVFRKNKVSEREMLWAGRLVVMIVSVVAFMIASSPNCKGIMALVECAWAGFGSAFGPIIILALYWKRFTYSGAVAGMITGFVVDAIWYVFLSSSTGLYEIIPGFICGLIAAVVVSLLSKQPSQDVYDLFEDAKKPI